MCVFNPDGDRFEAVMTRHLVPAGFTRMESPPTSLLGLEGPGIADGDTSQLWDALGLPQGPIADYRVDRDRRQFRNQRTR